MNEITTRDPITPNKSPSHGHEKERSRLSHPQYPPVQELSSIVLIQHSDLFIMLKIGLGKRNCWMLEIAMSNLKLFNMVVGLGGFTRCAYLKVYGRQPSSQEIGAKDVGGNADRLSCDEACMKIGSTSSNHVLSTASPHVSFLDQHRILLPTVCLLPATAMHLEASIAQQPPAPSNNHICFSAAHLLASWRCGWETGGGTIDREAWDDDSCKGGGGELRSKDGCFGCLGSSHLLRVNGQFRMV